jgi:hypothetical protein
MGFAATPDGMLYVFGGNDGGTEGGSAGMMGLHGASCAGRCHAACTRCTAAALALSTYEYIHIYIYTYTIIYKNIDIYLCAVRNIDIDENGLFRKCRFHAISQNTLCPHIYSLFNKAAIAISKQMSACKQAGAARLHALAGQRCLMLDAMKRNAA